MNMRTKNTLQISCIFLIVIVVLFFRRADAFTYPQFWAEDLPIFCQQFEAKGFWSLTTVYGGYLHVVPRLIAIFWGYLHVGYLHLPLVYNLSACLVTFLLAFSLWQAAVCMQLKNKVLYAVFFTVLPLCPDVFMNITNVHFITALFLVNFLLARDSGYGQKYVYGTSLLLLIVSLTGPASVVLSPLVVAIIIHDRKQLPFKKLLPLLVILAGGITQAICIKFIDPDFYRGFPGPTEKYHLLRLITNNTAPLVFLEDGLTNAIKIPVALLVFAVIMVVLYFGYRRIKLRHKYVLPLTALLFFTAFIKSYWPNESRILALENARYYFLPYACAGWVVIIGFDKQIKYWHMLLYAVFFWRHHDRTSFTLPNRHWQQQIEEYYQGKRDTVEINPDGWKFPLKKR